MRILPLEICHLKQLFDLNLENCPLVPKLNDVYKQGILYLLNYHSEKLQRENLREKIVNAAKEEIWVDSQISSIHEAIAKVLDSLEDESLFVVHRLLRNIKYVLPQHIDMVDPYLVKLALTTSKVGSANMDNTQSQLNNSISKPMVFRGKSKPKNQSGKNTVQMEASKISQPAKEFQSDFVVSGDLTKIDAEINNQSTILVEKFDAVTTRDEKIDKKEPLVKNPKSDSNKQSQAVIKGSKK